MTGKIGKFGLISIPGIALGLISAGAQAQTGNDVALLFRGFSQPWPSLLTLIVCIGLFVSIVPVLRGLLGGVTSGDSSSGDGSHGARSRFSLHDFFFLIGAIVAGIAVSYVISGYGEQLAVSAKHWTFVPVAGVLVISALTLFGFFAIRLPASFEATIHQTLSGISLRSIAIAFVCGLVLTVIVGVYTAPLLVAVFAIADAGDQSVAFALMLGFFVLYIIMVVAGNKSSLLLLESGRWRIPVRRLLGVLLLAAAIHLLGAFPEVPVLILWAMLLIVVAVYLGAMQGTSFMAGSSKHLFKGAGICILIWGGVSLVGASMGNRELSNPLPQLGMLVSGNLSNNQTVDAPIAKVFTYASNSDEFEQLLQSAKADSKPVLLDFYADWCLDCKRMDRTTFAEPTVVARLNNDFVAVKVDVTDPDDEFGRALRKRFGVFGPPALVLFDAQGNDIPGLLTYGYLDTDEMMALLSKVPLSLATNS